MKRLAVTLLALCALLMQGAAFALAGPMLPQEQVEQNLPCHDEAPASDSSSMDCCGDGCACPELCAGSAAFVAPAFSFAAPSRADFQPPVFASLRLSFSHSSPLRPPIASQS